MSDHTIDRPDSDGYQSDSETDSDGYQGESEIDSLQAEAEDPLKATMQRMTDGWWNKAGYATYWDYFLESEARWERYGFDSYTRRRRRRPRTREVPSADPPEIDIAAVASDATSPRTPRSRQVNVRLTELGYEALREAAKGYGISPSTLARLLIHRGALAVLEQRREAAGGAASQDKVGTADS